MSIDIHACHKKGCWWYCSGDGWQQGQGSGIPTDSLKILKIYRSNTVKNDILFEKMINIKMMHVYAIQETNGEVESDALWRRLNQSIRPEADDDNTKWASIYGPFLSKGYNHWKRSDK